MNRALLLLLVSTFTLSALAGEPTTAEGREKLIFLVQRLEAEPFGVVPDTARAWAMTFVENASDINPRINVALLSELMASKVPDQLAIFAQYILSSAVFVIAHPELLDDKPANALAGFTGAVHIYDKAVKRDPANHIPFWDELSKQNQAGTLKAHVEKLVTERAAPDKPKPDL